ncbi:hypothetical protein CEXT_356331 [Caerostris extrusa]|uniref:Uncharacterized protein n=1 Tax=Caerostris extrusa TaxID=172846 RepID=A0AAV4REA9_CAEEX|nr:hypothetical protein CEXT_356331 [Caerostris extrusa]
MSLELLPAPPVPGDSATRKLIDSVSPQIPRSDFAFTPHCSPPAPIYLKKYLLPVPHLLSTTKVIHAPLRV